MITEVIKGLTCAACLCPAVEVAQEGKYITLRNAKIDMYRGSMRLAVDQWGKVEALEDASFLPKVRATPASSTQLGVTPWPVCLQSKQL
jgi:hypothetical protein